MTETGPKILIIKHGALGDLITATGAFAALRQVYPQSQITLLTSPGFQALAERMGFFDRVLVDGRAKNPLHILSFCRRLKRENFSFVFDLQNSKRTSLYYQLMGPFKRPSWSGIAPGCSHPQTRPDREDLPAAFRFADQLRVAGVPLQDRQALLPDLCWMSADLTQGAAADLLDLPLALLIPGSSLSGAYKRWPASGYGALAAWFLEKGLQPVLIGGPDDFEPVQILREQVVGLKDLSMKLSLFEIAALARRAQVVVGNDTGPTLLAAGVGAPTHILWSGASDPKIYAPQGANVHVLYESDLKNLPPTRVFAAVEKHLCKGVGKQVSKPSEVPSVRKAE